MSIVTGQPPNGSEMLPAASARGGHHADGPETHSQRGKNATATNRMDEPERARAYYAPARSKPAKKKST